MPRRGGLDRQLRGDSEPRAAIADRIARHPQFTRPPVHAEMRVRLRLPSVGLPPVLFVFEVFAETADSCQSRGDFFRVAAKVV